MSIDRRASAILSVGLWIASAVAIGRPRVAMTPAADADRTAKAAPTKPLLTDSVDPHQFGTQDYTIKVLSAAHFLPDFVSSGLTAYCPPELSDCADGHHWYATLDLPAGAVIDYIGVSTTTTVDAAMGFTLHFRDHLGGTAQLVSFSFPAHPFATDYTPGPLGILIPANIDRVFVLDVELAPGLTDPQYFGFVEIWWRRIVSDPPATPTFGDVPSSHPFYQFIEALAKSGITGGCGGGNYCPDTPLTRSQMAVFLSKALGLHWPN
jgi:S-layer homology domain